MQIEMDMYKTTNLSLKVWMGVLLQQSGCALQNKLGHQHEDFQMHQMYHDQQCNLLCPKKQYIFFLQKTESNE